MKNLWKKVMCAVLAAGMLTAMSGCSNSGSSTAETTSAAAADTSADDSESAAESEDTAAAESTSDGDPLKIAVLIPGSINGGSWGTRGYNAASAVAEELGAEFSYIEIKSTSDAIDALLDYSERGYDLIFAHSYDYQDFCLEIAEDYPDTYYAVSGGNTYTDNITSINFKQNEASYLAGVVAAMTTKTNKVATVGSIELPNITEMLVGFEQGVKDTNPDVEVVRSYLGTESDTGIANEAAVSFMNSGVDVIDVHANAASQGCYEAGAANPGKCYMIAGNSQMSSEYPDLILADCYTSYEDGFRAVANDVANGTFKVGEGMYAVGIADNGVYCDLNSNLVTDQAVIDAYEAAKAKLQNGEITVAKTAEDLEG